MKTSVHATAGANRIPNTILSICQVWTHFGNGASSPLTIFKRCVGIVARHGVVRGRTAIVKSGARIALWKRSRTTMRGDGRLEKETIDLDRKASADQLLDSTISTRRPQEYISAPVPVDRWVAPLRARSRSASCHWRPMVSWREAKHQRPLIEASARQPRLILSFPDP